MVNSWPPDKYFHFQCDEMNVHEFLPFLNHELESISQCSQQNVFGDFHDSGKVMTYVHSYNILLADTMGVLDHTNNQHINQHSIAKHNVSPVPCRAFSKFIIHNISLKHNFRLWMRF
jgi:hypothetical protein